MTTPRYRWQTFWFTGAELVQLVDTHFTRARRAVELLRELRGWHRGEYQSNPRINAEVDLFLAEENER